MKRRVLVTAAVLTASLILTATPAFAAWVVKNITGSATVAATTMPGPSATLGAAPAPAANSTTVQVTFGTLSIKGTPLGSASLGGGYEVSRYSAPANGSALATTTCSTSPCSITNVPDGSWYFAVTPVLMSWRGTTTPVRTRTVVDATPPSGLTITGVGAGGNSETLSGNAGTSSTDQTTVSVVVCPTGSFPCANPEVSATRSVTSGTWSWNTGGIGNKKTHYAQVTQLDSAGNQATAVFGPFTT